MKAKVDDDESASHFCSVCGAWWLLSGDGTWQLRSQSAGEECCNNQPMHGNRNIVSARHAVMAASNIYLSPLKAALMHAKDKARSLTIQCEELRCEADRAWRELDTAAPAQQEPPRQAQRTEQEPVAWDVEAIESAIESYAADYECRGEDADGRDACYTPSESERAMIVDALHGLLCDDAFLTAFRSSPVVDQSKRMTEADVDEAMRLAVLYANEEMNTGHNLRAHLMQFVSSAKDGK